MPGFRKPPGADIQRIRQDLRDRYHDGFPILKELLQNADDAGTAPNGEAATQCAFALCERGLPGAQHALLRGPGLAVINDGGFTASDANSVTSFGLSNKADQSAAAGKFGLGLKSVFHWGEAFFYFSPHNFAGDPDIQSAGYDLLNPWLSRDMKTGRHREWDEEWKRTRNADFQSFRTMVSAIGGPQRWFGLWIPLRRREHTNDGQGMVQPIENRFPAANIDQLFGAGWRQRLAETMPLLRRIRAVRIYQHSLDAWQTVAEFCVSDDARRMCFGTEPGSTGQGTNIELRGQIKEAGRLVLVSFYGTESFSPKPALIQLRGHSAWPSQATLGPDGADLQVKEKAEPHGAVIFTRQASEGQAALRVHQAVFLPLGEPEPVGCPGLWRYNLYLHGFFFVDSGRRGIQPFDELPDDVTSENAQSESQVIQLWNRTLLHELVAPLVLPSLDAFVRQEHMHSAEIESLVCSLVKSELKKLTDWMCRGQRFIYRLKKDGGSWILEAWAASGGKASRWLKLPEPGFPEAELFELLPALARLSEEASVSFEGKPRLASDTPVKPSDEELAQLLGDATASAFQSAPHLAYLLELIPENGGVNSRLTTACVRLANQVLSQRLPEGKELRAKWTHFFQRLPAETFIRLPFDSTKAIPEIVRALAGATLSVAVLWQDYRNADGRGTLSWENLLPVLQRLGELHLANEVAVRQRSGIVVRLLQACETLPSAWSDAIATLPLFEVYTPNGACSAASLAELQTASRRGLLFTGGKEWATDLAKAAPTLNLLLTVQDVTKILNLGSAPCNVAACVALLCDVPGLAGEFSSRKHLFNRILTAALEHQDDAWAVLRCLLHGKIGAWQQKVTLFDETNATPILVWLLKQSLLAVGQPWRQLPAALVGQLQVNGVQRLRLKLVPATEENIEALISEVGPAKVDCAELTRYDYDYILARFSDLDVLSQLNIHETLDGRRVPIRPHTYMDDGRFTDLPEQFNVLVTRLRDNPSYARFATTNEPNPLVKKLSWEAVIEIALSQPEPALWWDAILTAIGKLGSLRVELRKRVLETPWLPQSMGSPTKPAELIYITGLENELAILPDNILSSSIPVLRLAKLVTNNSNFNTFKKTVLPSAGEALEQLAKLLMPHAAWKTGISGEWSAEQVKNWVQAVKAAPEQSLPVARIIAALHAEPTVSELLPNFLSRIRGNLVTTAYADVLKHIVQVHLKSELGNRPNIEQVYLRYLSEIDAAGVVFAHQVLSISGVQLLSRAGEWKPSSELSPPIEGISHEYIIINEWALAITNVINDCKLSRICFGQHVVTETAQTWQAMADDVKIYFEPWRQLLPSSDPIGAFLTLLSSPEPIAKLTSEYFQCLSRVDVRDWFKTNFEGVIEQLEKDFLKQIPIVEVQRSKTIYVVSLLGTATCVKLQEKPSSIILGGDPRITQGPVMIVNGNTQPGPRKRVLRLLPVDLFGVTAKDAVTMLQIAAEQIIERTVGRPVNLAALFETLSSSSQIEVQIAQSLVIESSLSLLRQLGAHAHPDINQALKQWDKAREDEAKAEALGICEKRLADENRRSAKQNIRRLLEFDESVHSAILAKVADKIRQYQYDASSVPFELWQNADDAVVELEELNGDVSQAQKSGFHLFATTSEIRVIHFGRLVNEYRLPGCSKRDDLEFNRDLEKMVIQSMSDKADAEARSGKALTGKFGLGFKSVYLVSDTPEIVSGSVDFVVRGGIYPVRLNQVKRDTLNEYIKSASPNNWRRGTIINLPIRPKCNTSVDDVVGWFQRLSPFLVVFSRRLKRLHFISNNGNTYDTYWHSDQLGEGLEVGTLESQQSKTMNALVLTRPPGTDRIQFLLGLNVSGFVPLPDDVPVFWVTTPTRATPEYGFAVNGPFEPDVGRVQLTLQSEKNRQLAGDLARVLATRLKIIGERSSNAWPELRMALKVAAGTSAYDFWNSLWYLLGKRFADKCHKEDKSPVAALARRILWDSESDGLQLLYHDCAALPTGLWGDYRTLMRLGELRRIAAGALDREEVFRAVRGWKVFQQRVAIGAICSGGQVASVLERLGVSLRGAETVHLATAVEWELGREKRADPELAAHLGELIIPEFMTGLEGGKANEREESEHEKLMELLRDVGFQAADGSWHKAGELAVATPQTGIEQDEPMRAAFAPRECQLNPAYTGLALQFFLASRSRLEADVNKMVKWILEASNQAVQVAALRYLLDGKLKHDLADGLRPLKCENTWLWKLDSFVWFKTEFSEDQRRELLAHVLKLFEEKYREMTKEEQGLETPPPPPKHIWTVEELWKWWKDQGEPTGPYTLEGEENWPLFHGGPICSTEERREELKRLLLSVAKPDGNPDGNALWYRLFGYACLVSAGRQTKELRDFWQDRLTPNLFWERTSERDFSEETNELFTQAIKAKFTDLNAGGEAAHFWRRVFYDVRKIRRMVCEDYFPATLMNLVASGRGQDLPHFLRTGFLSGPDQSRWVGTFGQSAGSPLFFVIRELVRLEVITDSAVTSLAYAVSTPVRRALRKIGWMDDDDKGVPKFEELASLSEWLHNEITKDQEFGPKLLPYFDIPLLHMGITHRGDKMPVPPR